MDAISLLGLTAAIIVFTFFVILNPIPFLITAVLLIGIPIFATLTRKNES